MLRISRDQSFARRLWLGAVALWLALSAIASASLWHLHHNAVSAQERELRVLSLALTNEVDRGLRGVEEGFTTLRLELRDGRFAVTGAEAERALTTRAALMPLVRKLWLTDQDGQVLSGSDAQPPPAQDFFSPSLDRLGDQASALSRPFMDLSKRESLVALAGGVAHDFNNILAAIVGFGEMAREASPPGSDQARHSIEC